MWARSWRSRSQTNVLGINIPSHDINQHFLDHMKLLEKGCEVLLSDRLGCFV